MANLLQHRRRRLRRPARGASRRPRSPARPQPGRRGPAHLACPPTLQHRTHPTQPAPRPTPLRADRSTPTSGRDTTPPSDRARSRRGCDTTSRHATDAEPGRDRPTTNLPARDDPSRESLAPTNAAKPRSESDNSSTRSNAAWPRRNHSDGPATRPHPNAPDHQFAAPAHDNRHSANSSTQFALTAEQPLALDHGDPSRFVSVVIHNRRDALHPAARGRSTNISDHTTCRPARLADDHRRSTGHRARSSSRPHAHATPTGSDPIASLTATRERTGRSRGRPGLRCSRPRRYRRASRRQRHR